MLENILSKEDYSLGLSPGFFRFYAHIGVLHALEDKGCLRATHVTGSSAGALVGSFLSAGMTPSEMIEYVLKIKREDIWDMGGVGGLLKGNLFQELIEGYLPVKNFEECKIPLGVTAYDLFGFKTKCITSGNIATAVRASCTFPGLFQPVMIDNSPHIDGGVWDDSGLMAMPQCIASRKIEHEERKLPLTASETNITNINHGSRPERLTVNVVCDRSRLKSSWLPEGIKGHRLLTIVLENVPMVGPFSMSSAGPVAYNTARQATLKALHSSHIQEFEPNHWVCYVDGTNTEIPNHIPPVIATYDPITGKRKLFSVDTSSEGQSNDGVNDDESYLAHKSNIKRNKSSAGNNNLSGGNTSTSNSNSNSNIGNNSNYVSNGSNSGYNSSAVLHELIRVPSLKFIGSFDSAHPIDTLPCVKEVKRLNEKLSDSGSRVSLVAYAEFEGGTVADAAARTAANGSTTSVTVSTTSTRTSDEEQRASVTFSETVTTATTPAKSATVTTAVITSAPNTVEKRKRGRPSKASLLAAGNANTTTNTSSSSSGGVSSSSSSSSARAATTTNETADDESDNDGPSGSHSTATTTTTATATATATTPAKTPKRGRPTGNRLTTLESNVTTPGVATAVKKRVTRSVVKVEGVGKLWE